MSQGYRTGTAFLEGRVVEERVGARVQDLVGEGRGFHGIDAVNANFSRLDALEQPDQARDVSRLGLAVVHRLLDEWVIGDRDRVLDVLLTRHLFG